MLAQAVTTARAAGVTARMLCRADSAYYGHAFVGTAIRHGGWFSVTARMNPAVTAAIAGIDEQDWTGPELAGPTRHRDRATGHRHHLTAPAHPGATKDPEVEQPGRPAAST